MRVPVQRLVLILPVEERVQDVLPGGMAGDVPAPPHEVVAQGCGDGKVNTTDCYNVVWDDHLEKYVRLRDNVRFQ